MVLRRSARHCQKGFNTRKITAPLLNKCLTNQMPRIKFQTHIPPSIPHGRTVPSRFGILRPPLEFNWLINAQIVTYIYEISLSPSIFAGKGGRTGIVTRQGHYFSATDTTNTFNFWENCRCTQPMDFSPHCFLIVGIRPLCWCQVWELAHFSWRLARQILPRLPAARSNASFSLLSSLVIQLFRCVHICGEKEFWLLFFCVVVFLFSFFVSSSESSQ